MESKRISEIINSMKSFSKESYHKSEVLPELFALQQEVVDITFSGEENELKNLRIWDVEKYLEKMNEERKGVASESLSRFENDCKIFSNVVRAEISGNKGEEKAYSSLLNLKTSNIIIRNVEFTSENLRTEIDLIVITQKGIFIVEVKNTSKNIFIDNDGNYYRIGEYQRLDSNIEEKMAIKEKMLRDVLANAGFNNINIYSVVVFTNNRIEVRNRHRSIKTCFLGQLTYLIDECAEKDILTESQMSDTSNAIENSRCWETYKYQEKINILQFKADFAAVIVDLESQADEPVLNDGSKTSATQKSKIRYEIRYPALLKLVGNTAAVIAIALTTAFITEKLK